MARAILMTETADGVLIELRDNRNRRVLLAVDRDDIVNLHALLGQYLEDNAEDVEADG